MFKQETIFKNEHIEVCVFLDTDYRIPKIFAYGIYEVKIDPEHGGQKEIAYGRWTPKDNEVSPHEFDTLHVTPK